LADTLVVLEAGRVRACGPVGEVLAGLDGPGVMGEDAGALLEAVVHERDLQWHLASLAFPGGTLWVRDTGLKPGRRVRVRVLARDVSIATEKPGHTSIQNLLACVVQAVEPDTYPAQALVRLQCGDAVLLARLTARAVNALGLAPGQQVWAQVKSVALVG
jgi:molybdate transport system ATP-binding protein